MKKTDQSFRTGPPSRKREISQREFLSTDARLRDRNAFPAKTKSKTDLGFEKSPTNRRHVLNTVISTTKVKKIDERLLWRREILHRRAKVGDVIFFEFLDIFSIDWSVFSNDYADFRLS